MGNRIFMSTALFVLVTDISFAQQEAVPDTTAFTKKETAALDIIGGADGPTAIFTTTAKPVTKGIVADIITKTPQRDVQVILNTNKTVTTAWDGTFSTNDTTFSSATVVGRGYLARNIRREEFADTIFLIPTKGLLNEVVVTGRKHNTITFNPINNLDAQLMAAGQNLSFNPLGLLFYVIDKLGVIPDKESKSRRKKEKRKAIINNY